MLAGAASTQSLHVTAGVAAVAVPVVPVVAFLAGVRLHDAVAAVRAEHATGSATVVAAVELSVVALLHGRLNDAVAAVRAVLATRRAAAVLAQIDAVVALLGALLHHAVAAVRAAALAVWTAGPVLARVALRSVVADLVRSDDAVAAHALARRLRREEVRQCELVVRRAGVA